MKIEFSHDKSEYVKQSLSVKDEFDEEIRHPWLFWIPVLFLIMIAFDYLTYGLRETISQFFPENDPTIPFIFGLMFGTGYLISVFGLFLMRRWSVYITILIMTGEWFYFSGYKLLAFRIIGGQRVFYKMFGEGLIPWIDALEPIYSLIARQLIVVITMFLIWRRLQ